MPPGGAGELMTGGKPSGRWGRGFGGGTVATTIDRLVRRRRSSTSPATATAGAGYDLLSG